MKNNIDYESLMKMREDYLANDKNTLLRHALSANSIDKICSSLDECNNADFTFSNEVKTMPVCNQKHSGRCWIFSASTVLREIIAKKLNIKEQFEISQNYISYFDKLEKYNFYMENVIALALQGEAHDSRKQNFLLAYGVSDGGQWDMFVSLVKKYGIVPKSVFSETEQSNNTTYSSRLCNTCLRQFSAEVYHSLSKGKTEADLHALKEEYLKKVYDILTNSFGVPPTEFDFEYIDNDDKYHIIKGLTPKSFFDTYIGEEIDEYVSLINAPTKDKEYYQTYNVELVGNVIGGKPVTHLNIPMDRMKELIISQLKHDEIVWFGSDVSYYGNRLAGSWDESAYDFKTPFGIDFRFDKADMLDFYQSAMNHAMCITGVNLKDNKPNRWKIENSWGDDLGHKGYFVMEDHFFDDFVYQAAIKKAYLNDKELAALKKEPKLLPPWDPFGTLAD